MRHWAKLFAVGIVGMLGCAVNVVATVVPEPALDSERPFAIAPVPPEPTKEEQLRGPEIEQALDEHPGYWRCAYQSARMHSTASKTVSVGMTLVNDESGEAAKLVLEPMLGHAILRACLVDVLSSMRFAPTSAPARIRRTITLGPSDEVDAAKLAALAPERLMEEPSESSCPTDIDERCETVSFDAIIDNALFVPETPSKDIEAARGTTVPDALDVTLHFCVDPTSGRTTRIRRSHPGPGQPVVDRLIATLSKWRVRPLELAGEPVLACSHVDFSIAFEPPTEVVEAVLAAPAMPPLKVVPAQALYTLEPHWKSFRSLRAAFFRYWLPRAGYRGKRWSGYNTTAFCIGVDGRVRDVRTKRRFGGSRRVDAIIGETIREWRFKPLILDGQPHVFCTERTFRITFEIQ